MRIILNEGVYNFLVENRSEVLHKKYVESNKIDNSTFEKIKDADPTTNKEYVEWLCQIWLYGKLKLEDLYKATEYLTLYSKVKHKLPGSEKNIYFTTQYTETYTDTFNGKTEQKTRKIRKLDISSLQELYGLIKQYEDKPVTNSEKANDAKKDAKKVYEDHKWIVVVPETEAASCYYGANTQWCTASKNNNYFDHYSKEGPIYINIDKETKEKFQFHLESDQFMDEEDSQINLKDFFYINKNLAIFYRNLWRDKIYKEHGIFQDENKNCYQLVNDYSHFADFISTSNVSSSYINAVLSGDGYEYFETHYDQFEGYMLYELNKTNEDQIIEKLKEEGVWDDDDDLEDNIKKSDEISDAISNAYSDATQSANESAASNDIINAIKDHFDFSEMVWVGEKLKCTYRSCPDPLTFIKDSDYEDDDDSLIQYSGNPPEGDIDKEYFNELVGENL